MVITPVPSSEAWLCPPGFILWVAHCFQDHFTKQKSRDLSGLLEVTCPRNGGQVSSHCRPCWLSTRQCCLPQTHTVLEILPILIMDCKFERAITRCYLLAALGSREPGKGSPALPCPVLAVCGALIK